MVITVPNSPELYNELLFRRIYNLNEESNRHLCQCLWNEGWLCMMEEECIGSNKAEEIKEIWSMDGRA